MPSLTPLYQAALEYIQAGRARLHMPGHKGSADPSLFGGELLPFDLTEADGLDSLYQSDGAIARTEEAYRRLYRTAASCISAGGSTLGIQAMLALAVPPGGKVIMARNVHIAAVNTMALLDLTPVWLCPPLQRNCPHAAAVTPAQVEEALERHPDADAVYVTSPDYYGQLCDVAAIGQICRERDVPLLVDNAHGAHLRFLPQDLHPMTLGASLCCDSLHKTLPVLTGGAMLHVGDRRFASRAKSRMSLFGSTSPSYLIMLSIDRCLDYLDRVEADLLRLLDRLEPLCALAAEQGYLPVSSSGQMDPARLTLSVWNSPLGRQGFGDRLRDYGVEPEYLGPDYCVLLPSAFNPPSDFQRLEAFLRDTPARGDALWQPVEWPLPPQVLSVREATFSASELLPVEQCAGRIAAEATILCPPGIPVVMPGEKIDSSLEKMIKNTGIQRLNVVK